MFGKRIGKTSITMIRLRYMVMFTIIFLPTGALPVYFLYGEAERGQALFYAWAGWQAVAFMVSVYIPRKALYILCYGLRRDPDYRRWRRAGGDLFYDNPANVFNSDPITVKMAIGTPPTVAYCDCGEALGQNYGNRCGNCGIYWDDNF